MIQGVILLWFVLTGLSFAFVSIDIRSTPAHPVMKWAFMILALLTGPFAAFFYVLGCREPLPGTHKAYVALRWRQVLGSTMHCAGGDGIGIIAGAAVAAYWRLPGWADLSLEYLLGFGFGWTIFQSLAMRGMAGGDYLRSLRQTFLPELLSMNLLMAGMAVTMHSMIPHIAGSTDPLTGGFWFVMSMALIVGFICAYPMNWWLVSKGLKHGMITVLPDAEPTKHRRAGRAAGASIAAKAGMTTLSVACLVLGIALAYWIGQ